ncbi:hypothetical protein [Williamsia herbipolensis]|uniref:hypothetical protein n=1 Tax=Williamsia herbipolensis TaxID=1603258 RepID=UPI0012376F97|nr:hypothetical protein [Williamsia herbipolensis]
MKVPLLAVDLGGILLTDPTLGKFWTTIARGNARVEGAMRHAWFTDLRFSLENGDLDESEVWNRLSKIADLRPDVVRAAFLSGFSELPAGVAGVRACLARNIGVVLATNHYAPWLEIWEGEFDWFGELSGYYCSSEMRSRKPDVAYFEELKKPFPDSSIIFVDDDPKNVEAAIGAGIISIRGDSTGRWLAEAFEMWGIEA